MKKYFASIMEHETHYNENGTPYHTDEIILAVKDNNPLYIKKVIADAIERTAAYENNKNPEIVTNGNSEIGYTVKVFNYQIMTNVNILDS